AVRAPISLSPSTEGIGRRRDATGKSQRGTAATESFGSRWMTVMHFVRSTFECGASPRRFQHAPPHSLRGIIESHSHAVPEFRNLTRGDACEKRCEDATHSKASRNAAVRQHGQEIFAA